RRGTRQRCIVERHAEVTDTRSRGEDQFQLLPGSEVVKLVRGLDANRSIGNEWPQVERQRFPLNDDILDAGGLTREPPAVVGRTDVRQRRKSTDNERKSGENDLAI